MLGQYYISQKPSLLFESQLGSITKITITSSDGLENKFGIPEPGPSPKPKAENSEPVPTLDETIDNRN